MGDKVVHGIRRLGSEILNHREHLFELILVLIIRIVQLTLSPIILVTQAWQPLLSWPELILWVLIRLYNILSLAG